LPIEGVDRISAKWASVLEQTVTASIWWTAHTLPHGHAVLGRSRLDLRGRRRLQGAEKGSGETAEPGFGRWLLDLA
jgi:hypothetical protein